MILKFVKKFEDFSDLFDHAAYNKLKLSERALLRKHNTVYDNMNKGRIRYLSVPLR